VSDFDVMSFDCYGTLIDWESGIWDALQPLLMANDLHDLARAEALNMFARLESAQEAATPSLLYPGVLARVHGDLAAALDIKSSDALDETFGSSVALWPAFPDTAEALRLLQKHFKLVILSNIDRASFAASNRKLGVTFDAIYTAEDIGSYKPNLANFDHMFERLRVDLGIGQDQIVHTAQSLFHDHQCANASGLANVWVDRQRLSEGGIWGATAELATRPSVDFTFFSMAELAAAVGRELA